MKKYLVLFLTVSTLVLTSCGKDEDLSDNNLKSEIIGKWYTYSQEVYGEKEIKEYGECGKEYTEFKNNGKLESIRYSQKGDCDKKIMKGTYSIKGNILKVTSDQGTTEEAKVSINGKSLIVKISNSKNGTQTSILKRL